MLSEFRFSGAERGALPPKALRKLAAAFARDGAATFDGLFAAGWLSEVRDEVLRRHGSGELKRRALVRDIGGRYAAILPLRKPFLSPELYGNERLRSILGALLGESWCLGSLETVISLPGSSRQHQHIDGPIRFDRRFGRASVPYARNLSDLPPYAVGLATPLCDVDDENGPTAIWAGSHKAALAAKPPSERDVARRFREERLTGPFGRSYAFDYRVFHGGLPNHSREPRPLLMMVFLRSWFRDPNLNEIHPSVGISARDLARVPQRYRDLFLLAPAARRQVWR